MRYLTDPVRSPEQDYDIEEGVIVEPTTRPTARKAYDEFTRFWPRSAEERRAEEESWAARSGPCIVVNPGRKPA